jgi:hypothetical protein
MGLFDIIKKPFKAIGKAISKPLKFVKETLDEGLCELMKGNITPERILLSALMDGAGGGGRCGGFPPPGRGGYGGYRPNPCPRPRNPWQSSSTTTVMVSRQTFSSFGC